jgi:hypothetical protein
VDEFPDSAATKSFLSIVSGIVVLDAANRRGAS